MPRTVLLLGAVSLLTDVSSEMIFPLLPAFLAERIAAAPLLLGAMEGLADLVAAASRWWAGRWTDESRRLRPLVIAGYALSTAARPLMGLITLWWHPLAIRAADRLGKGIRSSPRDALISFVVPAGARARAFGFHRGMDHLGAAVGALLASALVAGGLAVDRVFLLAAVPGLLAVTLLLAVREPPRPVRSGPPEALSPLPRRLLAYLGPVTLFNLANATDAFLLLRLTELGAAPALLPLAWLMLQAVKSAASFPAGALADRLGTPRLLLGGWVLYAGSYGALAWASTLPAALAVMALYGLYHALTEGAERALLADLTPAEARGRAFGLYHALSGVASLAAGLLFGAVWQGFGSQTAFLLAGALALASAALLAALLPSARGATT